MTGDVDPTATFPNADPPTTPEEKPGTIEEPKTSGGRRGPKSEDKGQA